ncbi:MAG: hypothetical protein ACI9R3_004669 [Verrucomicrobiales bacterium]
MTTESKHHEDYGAASAYRQLRADVFGEARVQEDGELFLSMPPSELELQSRWFAGDFGREFVTTCGKAVRIVQFGHWNHSAGPDFTDSVVVLGNGRDGEEEETLRGSIELDTNVRDWEHHGHGENSVYRKVVLHLFIDDASREKFYTRTDDHVLVPQVQLEPSVLSAKPAGFVPEARNGRCSAPLETMPAARINALLTAAARFRLEAKGRRLRRVAEIHGESEMLYQAFAEAFGYRQNRLPMTVLAQRLPLSVLRSNAETAEALLFGLAGFLETRVFEEASDETRSYLRGLWETWWKRRVEFQGIDLGWNFAGSRPVNHPQRRVSALSCLARESQRVFRHLWESAAPAFDRKAFVKVLGSLGHSYWDNHYTLTSATAARPMALVGGTRIKEILANIAYPLVVPHNAAAWDGYCALRGTLENEKSRRAVLRLMGRRENAQEFTRYIYQQQALLQIYDDFCMEDDSDCEDCLFPEQLRTW